MTGFRIPIERIEADGTVTPGTARMRGGTIDDFQTIHGTPLTLPAGATFVVAVRVAEEDDQ